MTEEHKCFECGSDLVGPYCPACNPRPREPLHRRVGKQVLVLHGATLANNWPAHSDKICLLASRETMEQIWNILQDLQEASHDADQNRA